MVYYLSYKVHGEKILGHNLQILRRYSVAILSHLLNDLKYHVPRWELPLLGIRINTNTLIPIVLYSAYFTVYDYLMAPEGT